MTNWIIVFLARDAGFNLSNSVTEIDWNLCVICQIDNISKLVDPNKNVDGSVEGYEILAEILREYDESTALPTNFLLLRHDHGKGITDTCRENNDLFANFRGHFEVIWGEVEVVIGIYLLYIDCIYKIVWLYTLYAIL